MSSAKSLPENKTNSILVSAAWLGAGVFLTVMFMVGTLLAQTPAGLSFSGFISWLFATDSTQMMWYITRSAGLTGYLLMWLSVFWGLGVSSKIFDNLLHRSFTYEFHQFLSLLALAFVALHLGILFFDRYMPYSFGQVFVPFLSPYRPLWVGIGVLSMYTSVLVTVSFYFRGRIGLKAFRTIHVFSLLAYLGVTVHGFFAGTDTSLPAVMAMYVGTFLSIVFLMSYWLIQKSQKKSAVQKSAPVRAMR
jgi:methionine sulfoxide reductase heme-binding subunit